MSNQVFKSSSQRYFADPNQSDVLTLSTTVIRNVEIEGTVAIKSAYFDKINGALAVSTVSGGVTYVAYPDQKPSTMPYYTLQAQSTVNEGATQIYIKQDCVLEIEYGLASLNANAASVYTNVQIQAVNPTTGVVRKFGFAKNNTTQPLGDGTPKVCSVLGGAVFAVFKGEFVRMVIASDQSPVQMYVTSVGTAGFAQDMFITETKLRIGVL